jgi:hypothetical protein
MKISKRQLKKIIKEEKKKLLKESIVDMVDVEGMILASATELSEVFADLMITLFDEDPAMFSGRSTKEEWEWQVDEATMMAGDYIMDGINKAIQRAETELHDGKFRRENSQKNYADKMP